MQIPQMRWQFIQPLFADQVGPANTGEEELGRRRAGGGGHLGEGGAHIGENGGVGDIDIEIFKLKKCLTQKNSSEY
jgi:hypothetical protein